MSQSPEISRFLQAAIDAVRAAGAVALSRQKTLGPSRFKGAKDVVTEADIECDRLIRGRLLKDFPDFDLLTEEEGALRQGSDYCWIVDPIDGTINYAHGIPLWGVSVGLSHKGKMLCGAIYLPVEVYELWHRPGPVKAATLVLNLAVVVYLLWTLRSREVAPTAS